MRDLFHFYKSSKNARRLGDEILIDATLFICCFLIFVLFAILTFTNKLIYFDREITNFIYSFRSPEMRIVMKGLSSLGGDMLALVAVIIPIVLMFKNFKKAAIHFWFLVAFGTVLNHALKNMFQRLRPNQTMLTNMTTYSFPSGHSMVSFIFYMSLAYFIFRHLDNKRAGTILACVFSVLVLGIGVSRVYLGAHYPSDVLAGYAAGAAWVYLVVMIEKIYDFRNLWRSHHAS